MSIYIKFARQCDTVSFCLKTKKWTEKIQNCAKTECLSQRENMLEDMEIGSDST